jgi:hypothetical protein
MIDISGWRKRQIALDQKAENSSELGLDYAPTWVGLTEEDLKLLSAEYRIVYGSWVGDFAKGIEDKLKDLNT